MSVSYYDVGDSLLQKFPEADFLYILDVENNYEHQFVDLHKNLNFEKLKKSILLSYNIQKCVEDIFETFYQAAKKYVFVTELRENILLVIGARSASIQQGLLISKLRNFLKDFTSVLPNLEKKVHSNDGISKVLPESNNDARKIPEPKELNEVVNAGVRTQKEILGSFSEFHKFIPQSFLIFSPKDSISGDFYWFKKFNNKIVLVLADCTGHGMEGGLMTVMGASMLKVIVNELNILTPNIILEQIHHHILEMGGGSEEMVKTLGMEMAICTYDLSSNILYYSGANINLQSLDEEGKLNIVKANRLVLGSNFHINSNFLMHQIEDASQYDFFMYTDGVIDQIGGGDEKKLGRKTLFEVLEKVKDKKSYHEKESGIREYLSKWRGSNEQTDDLTLISFKP